MVYSFHHKWANLALLVWIDLFRSFPVLVLLILIFYGLPFLGLKLPSFAACVLALVLNYSGYYGEIFRAGIELVPHGQREAAPRPGAAALAGDLPGDPAAGHLARAGAACLQFAWSWLRPRRSPPWWRCPSFCASARVAQEQTYNPTPLTAAAVLFFVLLWPFARWVAKLERDMIVRQR